MKVSLEPISVFIIAFSFQVLVECKGRGGGARGGGAGGGVSGVVVSNAGSSGRSFGRSGQSNRKGVSGGGAAVIVGGGGAAGFFAYKARQDAMKEDGDRYFDSSEQRNEKVRNNDCKPEGATSCYGNNSASEGIGMSSWTFIFLIFTIIVWEPFGGTAAMYFYLYCIE